MDSPAPTVTSEPMISTDDQQATIPTPDPQPMMSTDDPQATMPAPDPQATIPTPDPQATIPTPDPHATIPTPDATLEPQELVQEPVVNIELEQMKATLKANPCDLNRWQELLTAQEHTVDKEALKATYEDLLANFPFCYGYWLQLAAMQGQNKGMDAQSEVYESAVKVFPVSIDIWTAYTEHLQTAISLATDKTPATQLVTDTYERAIAAAGIEFKATPLYDAYLSWATLQGDMSAVVRIYNKALSTVLENGDKYITQYTELIQDKEANVFATEEEIEEVSTKLGAVSPSELRDAVRESTLQSKTAAQAIIAAERDQRKPFEDKITRTYFHTMRVDDASLKNWREYILFEEAQQALLANPKAISQRVTTLYERCVTVCALYEEFWLRYAAYLEPRDVEAARTVLNRGSKLQIFPTPSYSYAHAWFEEAHDNVEAARTIFTKCLQDTNPVIDSFVKCANFERRHGNAEKGKEVFEKALIAFNQTPKYRVYVNAAFAHYLSSLDDADATRNQFKAATEQEKASRVLFFQWLDFEVSQHMKIKTVESEAQVEEVFTTALSGELSNENKNVLRKRRLMFLDEYSVTPGLLRAAQTDLAEARTRGVDRKRKIEEEMEAPMSKRQHLPAASWPPHPHGHAHPYPHHQQQHPHHNPHGVPVPHQHQHPSHHNQQGYGGYNWPQQQHGAYGHADAWQQR